MVDPRRTGAGHPPGRGRQARPALPRCGHRGGGRPRLRRGQRRAGAGRGRAARARRGSGPRGPVGARGDRSRPGAVDHHLGGGRAHTAGAMDRPGDCTGGPAGVLRRPGAPQWRGTHPGSGVLVPALVLGAVAGRAGPRHRGEGRARDRPRGPARRDPDRVDQHRRRSRGGRRVVGSTALRACDPHGHGPDRRRATPQQRLSTTSTASPCHRSGRSPHGWSSRMPQ